MKEVKIQYKTLVPIEISMKKNTIGKLKWGSKDAAFTLIELIVVMSIMAILVLLAVPKFLGYSDKVNTTQIRNDIKVLETKIDEYLINHESFPDTFIDGVVGEGQLYDRKGKIEAAPSDLKVVDRTFYPETELPGTFYTDPDGVVVYEDNKPITQQDDPFNEIIEVVEVPSIIEYGDGTSTNPYKIWYLEDLADINDNLSAHYMVMRDLDFNNDDHYLDKETNKPLWTTDLGWTPINSFSGDFNGNNKKLLNLMMNNTPMPAGLFMQIEDNSLVHDYKLLKVNVRGQNLVGTIAGQSFGTIDGITVSGKISSLGAPIGGITSFGENITNSQVKADISGGTYVGGILAGTQYNDTGETHPYELTNLSFEGNIETTAGNNVGGIAGNATSAIVENVNFSGSILSPESTYVGGIFGIGNEILLTNANAHGEIFGDSYIGGLFGQLTGDLSIVADSSSHVDLTGHGYNIGGISAVAGIKAISNTISYGDVSSQYSGKEQNMVAGFIGSLWSGLVESSESYSNVSANDATFVGGFIGYSTGRTMNNKSYGNVTSNNSVIDDHAGVIISNTGGMFGSIGPGESGGDIAYGSVYGNGDNVGGFIGVTAGLTIMNGQSFGETVAGLNNVSGFLGYSNGGVILENVTSAVKEVRGRNSVGALVGKSDYTIINNSFSDSNLYGVENVNGLIGEGNPPDEIVNSNFNGTITLID